MSSIPASATRAPLEKESRGWGGIKTLDWWLFRCSTSERLQLKQVYEILVYVPLFPIQWPLPINTSALFSGCIQGAVPHSTQASDCFFATPGLADLWRLFPCWQLRTVLTWMNDYHSLHFSFLPPFLISYLYWVILWHWLREAGMDRDIRGSHRKAGGTRLQKCRQITEWAKQGLELNLCIKVVWEGMRKGNLNEICPGTSKVTVGERIR